MTRFMLGDDPWERIEPLMSGNPTDGGVTGRSNRRLIEAVLWIARIDSTWRDLSEDLGNGHPVSRRSPRGSKKGSGRRFDRPGQSRRTLNRS